jgi:GTPase SAR1 family protein
VYSITSRASFGALERFSRLVLEEPENANVPFIIVGNKLDLCENNKKSMREVSMKDVEELVRNKPGWNGCKTIFETSAKDGTNVEECFLVAAELGRAYIQGSRYANKRFCGIM